MDPRVHERGEVSDPADLDAESGESFSLTEVDDVGLKQAIRKNEDDEGDGCPLATCGRACMRRLTWEGPELTD